jgi:hypothetical protein
MPEYVFINDKEQWIGQLKTKPVLYPTGYNSKWFEFVNRHEANGFAKALNLLFKETFRPLRIAEAKKIIDSKT